MELLRNTTGSSHSYTSPNHRNVYITVTPSQDDVLGRAHRPPADAPDSLSVFSSQRGRRSSNSHHSDTQSATGKSRNYSGSVHRHSSILSGLRELMNRPRSESMGNAADRRKMTRNPVNKKLVRVQIESCPVESVYDLREEDDSNETQFYNDSLAFRRPRSNSSDFLILRKTSRPLSVEVVGLVDDFSDPYKQYMSVVDCYELAPHAGSVVILDKCLKLEKAFKAVTNCGVGAALVWSEEEQRVVSILTLTDFLILLLDDKTSAESRTPQLVHEAISKSQLVTLDASKTLLFACEEFCSNRIHRIAVLEPNGDVLYFLTIKRILQAIHKQNRSLHFAQWLTCEIKASTIGTWQHLKSIKMEDSLRLAAKLMLDYRISSVPVVDDQMRPVDVICKADIASALSEAKDIKASFEQSTVSDVIRLAEARTGYRNRARFLYETDSVGCVLDAILTQDNCKCLFIKGINNDQLIGAVSLSDIITYILDDGPKRNGPQHQQLGQKLLHPLSATMALTSHRLERAKTVGSHDYSGKVSTSNCTNAFISTQNSHSPHHTPRVHQKLPARAVQHNQHPTQALPRSSTSEQSSTQHATRTSHEKDAETPTRQNENAGGCAPSPASTSSAHRSHPTQTRVQIQFPAETSALSKSFQAPSAESIVGSVRLPGKTTANDLKNNTIDDRTGENPHPKLLRESTPQKDGLRSQQRSANTSNTSKSGNNTTATGNISTMTLKNGLIIPTSLDTTSRISAVSGGTTNSNCSSNGNVLPTIITIQSPNRSTESLEPGKTAPPSQTGKTGNIIPNQNTHSNSSTSPDDSSINSLPFERLLITNR